MTADTNVTLALLDAIWRAFDETKLYACTPKISCPNSRHGRGSLERGASRPADHRLFPARQPRRHAAGQRRGYRPAPLARRQRERAMGVRRCTSRTPSGAISAKGCPARTQAKGARRPARKTTQKHPTYRHIRTGRAGMQVFQATARCRRACRISGDPLLIQRCGRRCWIERGDPS